MARVKIDFPKHTIGKIFIPVRITDINYGNHLGNDALVGIIHEARVQWLRQHNYTELDIAGASLIQSDLAVRYLAECFYGDVLEIDIASGETSSAGFELYYQISTNRNNQMIIIALAKTGLVFFDYNNRKVTSMPEAFKKILLHD
jgi:acyl-CoA thioesterase FadM